MLTQEEKTEFIIILNQCLCCLEILEMQHTLQSESEKIMTNFSISFWLNVASWYVFNKYEHDK